MKNTVIITFLCISIRLFAQIPNDNLILYLPFDGNANDESGNEYNGTVFGARLIADRFGAPNSAYFFDGRDDYIEIDNFGDIVPTEEITVSMWVMSINSKGQFQFMLCPDNNRFAVSINYFHAGMNTIFWDCGWRGEGGNAPGRLYYRPEQLDTIWHHYVFVSSVSQNIMKIYKDGKLLNSKNEPLPILNSSGKSLKIGSGDNAYYFHGLIDDLRIYSRVLNSYEMNNLYHENASINHITANGNESVTNSLINDEESSETDDPDKFNTFKIYPNPTKDVICISTDKYDLLNKYILRITNVKSQVVFESIIDQQEIQVNIKEFGATGAYFVHLLNTNSEIIETKTIILE